MIKNSLIILSIFLLSACSIQDVKPWQKDILAKDIMNESGGNNSMKKFKNHIYFSKEGSKGGGGVAGGGCGCN